jgi:hypothetical protein
MNSVTRKVEVTQEDIDKGCRMQVNTCPVARAIKRTFPEFDEDLITVHEQEVIVFYKGWSRKIPLPESVEGFIRAYDYLERPELGYDPMLIRPFSFDLTVVI